MIKARIPSILSNINKNIDELESEMNELGRPISVDAGVSYWLLSKGEMALGMLYNMVVKVIICTTVRTLSTSKLLNFPEV